MNTLDIELAHTRHFFVSSSEACDYFDLFVGKDKINRLTREELNLLQSAIEHAKVGLEGLCNSFQK